MIDPRRATGPGAAVVKYDVLTALGLIGMHGPPVWQASMLRLMTAVTVRYNWRADEMAVGQAELARIWGVAERTAKREVRRLTDARVLSVQRQGVRGRVAAYRLNLVEIAARSRDLWPVAGPDFGERMAALAPAETRVVRVDFGAEAAEAAGGTWRGVRARLRQADPATFANWYDQLSFIRREGGAVTLAAATAFVGRYVELHLSQALIEALSAEFGPVDRLRIEVRG